MTDDPEPVGRIYFSLTLDDPRAPLRVMCLDTTAEERREVSEALNQLYQSIGGDSLIAKELDLSHPGSHPEGDKPRGIPVSKFLETIRGHLRKVEEKTEP